VTVARSEPENPETKTPKAFSSGHDGCFRALIVRFNPLPLCSGMSRILITTCGSLGDLYPYVALGLGLRERGHDVVVGTSPCYQRKVESLGLEFHAVRPDSEWLNDPVRVRRLSHPRWGLLRAGREWLMPALRESYTDTRAAAEGADLLVGMMACYATRLVAETTGIPWVSALHLPLGFFSACDVSVLDFAPAPTRLLRRFGREFWGPVIWSGKRASRFLAKPWYRLRSELGLPPTSEGNPLADSHSPLLVLAMFSELLAPRQPDWPPQTVITGCPIYEGDRPSGLTPELARFLDAGPPPIVFTLGTAVSMRADAGRFYEHCRTCARLLNRRAVLVVGPGHQNPLPATDDSAVTVAYAPFAEVFPRAAAIVHHGGIGTTSLAIRAARPALIVPFAWDQYDNADRAMRLGVSRTLHPRRFTPSRAAAELRPLLDDPGYQRKAHLAGEKIRQENGVQSACDAIEVALQTQA